MSNPWLVIAGVAALAVVYVLLPVVAEAYRAVRGTRRVRCPGTGGRAQVGLDAAHAAWTASYGRPRLRVARCSLWPGRARCGQTCVAEAAGAGAAGA
jgi:hypothetical protein